MAEPTDADRQRAQQVADRLADALDDMSGLYPAGVDVIAAALAEERERARAADHEWECPNCGATTRARMADR